MHPAVDNLYAAKKVLDELGITFWLEAGTLLLAYRDQKVDETDIDISVYDIKKVIDNLDKFYDAGFTMGHRFDHPSGKATEISLSRNRIKMDIWTKEFLNGEAWWLSYDGNKPIPHHLSDKYFKKLDKLTIWDETWNIPSHTEEFLEKVYGTTWRIPNPNWRWNIDPVCIDYNYNFLAEEIVPDKSPKYKDVTVIISNFLRKEYTYQCVKSLKYSYPRIKFIVGNQDKPEPSLEKFVLENGGKYIELPFDCGITVARNILVSHVDTKYCIIGDDDFFYDKSANLGAMVSLMDISDVCGGRIFEGTAIRNYQGFIDRNDNKLLYSSLNLDSFDEYNGHRYKKCDLTFNFFMAKTEKLKSTKWDEKIKVSYEHSDWFLTAKENGLVVIFTPDCVVKHKFGEVKCKRYDEYQIYRNRKTDRDHFFKKRGLISSTDMNGFEDKYLGEE